MNCFGSRPGFDSEKGSLSPGLTLNALHRRRQSDPFYPSSSWAGWCERLVRDEPVDLPDELERAAGTGLTMLDSQDNYVQAVACQDTPAFAKTSSL